MLLIEPIQCILFDSTTKYMQILADRNWLICCSLDDFALNVFFQLNNDFF